MWKPEHRLAADRSGLRYPNERAIALGGIVGRLVDGTRGTGFEQPTTESEERSNRCRMDDRSVHDPARSARRAQTVGERARGAERDLLCAVRAAANGRRCLRDLPPKSTVHDYPELWNWDGTLERIYHAPYITVREEEGREASPTVAIIDSQTAKGAQKGGLGLILRAMTRARRSRVASGTSWSTRWVSC
jgi:hypothetical protein